MQRLAHRLAGLAIGVLLASGAGAANAALVVNGGFSQGTGQPGPGGFQFLSAGNTSITGWTISSGSIDWINTYWQSSDADGFSVDLVGSSLGTITQSIATAAGATYRLSFDISSNPDVLGNTPRSLNVSAGSTSQLLTFSAPHTRANMGWLSQSLNFTATGASTLISFSGTNGQCCYGAALDNVDVQLLSREVPEGVPEPTTWALMIGGFGLAGAALRRRRLASA